jgi:hypothetical protein
MNIQKICKINLISPAFSPRNREGKEKNPVDKEPQHHGAQERHRREGDDTPQLR